MTMLDTLAIAKNLRDAGFDKADLLALENRLTIRGGLMAAAAVAILASIKFFE